MPRNWRRDGRSAIDTGLLEGGNAAGLQIIAAVRRSAKPYDDAFQSKKPSDVLINGKRLSIPFSQIKPPKPEVLDRIEEALRLANGKPARRKVLSRQGAFSGSICSTVVHGRQSPAAGHRTSRAVTPQSFVSTPSARRAHWHMSMPHSSVDTVRCEMPKAPQYSTRPCSPAQSIGYGLPADMPPPTDWRSNGHARIRHDAFSDSFKDDDSDNIWLQQARRHDATLADLTPYGQNIYAAQAVRRQQSDGPRYARAQSEQSASSWNMHTSPCETQVARIQSPAQAMPRRSDTPLFFGDFSSTSGSPCRAPVRYDLYGTPHTRASDPDPKGIWQGRMQLR